MTLPPMARSSSPGRVSAVHARGVTSSTDCSRLELFSSGAKTRKLRWSRLSRMTSRRKLPEHPGRLDRPRPGLLDLDRVVAEVGHPQLAQQLAAVRVRVRRSAAGRRPGRASGRGAPVPRCRRRAPRACTTSATTRGVRGARGSSGCPRTAPGASASDPRSASRRRSPVRSSPWGSAGRSSATAAGASRRRGVPRPGSAGSCRGSRRAPGRTRGACPSARRPATMTGAQP